MSLGTVITQGVGSFGDIAHVVWDGFGVSAPAGPAADASILTQAFGALTAASASLVTEGFRPGAVAPVAGRQQDGAALRFLRRARGDVYRETRMLERYTFELERCRRVAQILQEEARTGPPHAEDGVTFAIEVDGKRVPIEISWSDIDDLDEEALAWKIYERMGLA